MLSFTENTSVQVLTNHLSVLLMVVERTIMGTQTFSEANHWEADASENIRGMGESQGCQ